MRWHLLDGHQSKQTIILKLYNSSLQKILLPVPPANTESLLIIMSYLWLIFWQTCNILSSSGGNFAIITQNSHLHTLQWAALPTSFWKTHGDFSSKHIKNGTENYRIGGAWSSPWEDKWWQCHSDCALSWLITEGNYHYFPLLVSINPLARHITKLCVIICSSVPQVQSICPSFLQCQHSPHLTWTMLQLSGAQIFLGTFWHQVLGLWSPDGDSM